MNQSHSTPTTVARAGVMDLLQLLHRLPPEEEGPYYSYLWEKAPEPGTYSRSSWFTIGDPLPAFNPDMHVYFGVHPCKEMRLPNQRGRVEDIACAACLYADYDLHPGPEGASPTATFTPGEGGVPEPSALVFTGGGYHAYWLLDQARAVEGMEDLQRDWVVFAGADPAAQDMARVLRLPGTRNHKYNAPAGAEGAGGPPLVHIVKLDPTLVYDFTSLRAACPPRSPSHAAGLGSGGPKGIRETMVSSKRDYLASVMRRIEEALLRSRAGNRNDTMLRCAAQVGQYLACPSNGLSREAVAAWLQARTTLVEPERSAVISSGLDRGAGEPILLLDPDDIAHRAAEADRPEQLLYLAQWAKLVHGCNPLVRAAHATLLAELGLDSKTNALRAASAARTTDADVRDAFLQRHPQFVLHPLQGWKQYQPDAGYYVEVPDAQVERAVMECIEDSNRDALTASRIASVVKMAALSRFQPADVWDAKDLIVCRNCTLELLPRRGEIIRAREHSPMDFSTRYVEYGFDPDATCPNFMRAIDRLAEPVQAFLQEFVGLSFTTSTVHDVMVWMVGRRGSGKSTIVEGLISALGSRAVPIRLQDIQASRFVLSTIMDKTLVYGADVGVHFIRNTDILNQIVSGESFMCEAKYQDPVQARPVAKVLWAMTRMPDIRGADDGLFRRIHVVQVPPLDPADRDVNVRRAVKAEGAGILMWALDGLARLQKRGHFDVPRAVREPTRRYQDDQDKVLLFTKEALRRVNGTAPTNEVDAILHPQSRLKAILAYNTYRQWCSVAGYNPERRVRFYDELRRIGLQVEVIGGQNCVLDHELAPRTVWDPEGMSIKITATSGPLAGTTVETEC